MKQMFYHAGVVLWSGWLGGWVGIKGKLGIQHHGK